MRLVVQQKIVSLAGKYFIKDRDGNDIYIVKGSYFPPKKYWVTDTNEKEIIKIKKKLFRIFATFDYYQGDKVVGRAKRKFALRTKYEISGAKGEYSIDGNILDWDYTLMKNGVAIATVFKKITLYRDSYIVDVEDESELPMILGTAIMFDHVHHRRNSD